MDEKVPNWISTIWLLLYILRVETRKEFFLSNQVKLDWSLEERLKNIARDAMYDPTKTCARLDDP